MKTANLSSADVVRSPPSTSQGRAAETRVAKVVATVTGLIRDQGLGPGDALPSELSLARDLDVSRAVVREAFQSLSALHLIEMNNGRRARVAALDHGTMALLIDHGVQTDQISIQQIYDVRRTIEIRTAALAALRRTEDEADTIAHHAESMRSLFDDEAAVMEHDIAFHEAIARASCNPVFALIMGSFHSVTRRTWLVGWRSRPSDDDRMRSVAGHEAIAAAVRAGEPNESMRHMAEHFDKSVKALIAAGIN